MPSSKKRSESKKNSGRPKRPLSAYNLFYRYKRAKILEANSGAGPLDTRDAFVRFVLTPPGLEFRPSNFEAVVDKSEVEEARRSAIREAVGDQLFAKDTRNRLHRKSGRGFKLSFTEMNKIMVDTWKDVDECGKSAFQELADEARKDYQVMLSDYNREQQMAAMGIGKIPSAAMSSESPTKKPRVVYEPASKPSSKPSFGTAWEPVPLKNQPEPPSPAVVASGAAFAATCGPCSPASGRAPAFGSGMRQVSDLSQDTASFGRQDSSASSNNMSARNNFNVAPPLPMCAPAAPFASPVCSLRALVTPTWSAPRTHFEPTQSFLSGVMAPPFAFDVNEDDEASNLQPKMMSFEESNASLESTSLDSFDDMGPARGHDVSVGDFMELIATLDDTLNY